MSRPPKAHLTPNETFLLKLWIARAYLVLEENSDELAYQLEWIRACTGLDEEHFAPYLEMGRWGANQVRDCIFDVDPEITNAADALTREITRLERELVSS